MKITLISPRIALQKGDFLGSGVPYWPLELAVFASFLRNCGHHISVLDLFGESTKTLEDKGDFYLQGQNVKQHLKSPIIANAELIVIYAISYMSHHDLLYICNTIRENDKKITIAILENSQAVTAYALPSVSSQFFEAGADYLICGEPYWNCDQIISTLTGNASTDNLTNVISKTDQKPHIERLINKEPSYPIPAWDLFPIENYWSLPYSHGPKTDKFFPILTSRGCPFPCDFCVVPETNQRRWRGRKAEDVVEEIVKLKKMFGVKNFQVEDLNPTVSAARMNEICRLLIEKNADINFYLVSGTKAETVKLEQIPLYAQAGCRYISISPESGSHQLMKTIGKNFDYEHGLRLVAECKKYGIETQACLLVGHPTETDQDFQLSAAYLRQLVRSGLSEVAIFIIAPFAGSKLFKQSEISINSADSFISFSPKGRSNYQLLEYRRKSLIAIFFREKLTKGGFDIWKQGLRSFLGTPKTKMENLPKRLLYIYYLIARHKVCKFLRSEDNVNKQ